MYKEGKCPYIRVCTLWNYKYFRGIKKKFANEPMVVISGFHMFKNGGYTKEEIANIESIAKKLNKMYTIFYTGHCTGDKAYEMMHKIMKDKLKAIHTGKIVEIKE